MKKLFPVLMMLALFTFAIAGFAKNAHADSIKMVGVITKIEMAADGKSAIATLKDTKSSESIDIFITDDLTLDKFKEKRIVLDDEIRTKYEKQDGKNAAKIFKKTAGC